MHNQRHGGAKQENKNFNEVLWEPYEGEKGSRILMGDRIIGFTKINRVHKALRHRGTGAKHIPQVMEDMSAFQKNILMHRRQGRNQIGWV